ncbi:MAG: hypothetical protein HW390_45 [Candidatus Brocadiaceae bacterium]|nr:hypothetical protein [Candidatus Brocadiaceae bacterium]
MNKKRLTTALRPTPGITVLLHIKVVGSAAYAESCLYMDTNQ